MIDTDSKEPKPDATQLFVANFCGVRYEDLPPEVVAVTKDQVLDFFGVALGGSSEAGVGEMRDLVLEWGGAPQSSTLRWGDRLPAPNAAQVNATMAHSLDFDDVHEDAIMHPGVVTIPTALAMSEYLAGTEGRVVGGPEFITAVALGTDFICRLGLATRPGENIHAFGWHLTTLYGYMTAAAVAARLLGLDADGVTNAIGIGYHQSSGNGQCVKDGALTKRMGPGMAVRGGIASALMAKRGITGARNSLEGQAGIYQVYHGGSYSREILVDDLGRRFEGVNVSIKPYPCCRGVHPFIDAALALVAKYDVRPEEAKSILINCGEGTNFLLATPFESKARPRTFVDSQFSIIWGVATALARRRATLDDFTETAIKSPDILDVSAKISVQVDPELNRGDVGIEPARVSVTTTDGRVLTEQVDLPTGTPSRPLSFADIGRKFEDCLAHAGHPLPAANAHRLVGAVANLEKSDDVCDMIALAKR
ncbi:MAG: MmgE/PrpD family protein [Actinobacteria bacterium]|jgi:2-methylcitrate dehydratase PrpD|nr:MmgE/PrpD family protein [Actinomycetota bacterium]